MSKLSNSFLVPVLPLLRLPLTVNNIAGCTLSFIHGRTTYITQGVFLVVSLVFSVGVALNNLRIKRRQALQLEEDLALKFNAWLLLPVVDLFFAVSFLTLYIMSTSSLDRDYWWDGLSLLGVYASFSGLIAWVFHLVIAVAEFRLWFQYKQTEKPRCPHCDNEIRQGKLPEFRGGNNPQSKADARCLGGYVGTESLINETGDGEGDRLILLPADK